MWPDSMASASAVSSIRSPRAVLMIRMPFFAFASRSALTMFFVVGVEGMWSERKSDRANRSSSDTSSTPRSPATSSDINGSCAMMRMSNEAARLATSWPMRPRPARPRVFSRTSSPRNFFFSHLPCFMAASAAGTWRASASMSATASSATLMLLAPGAFITTIPRALAAGTSTLSTPVPARAMTRSFGAAWMSGAVTFVALRTTMASASATSAASCSGGRPARVSTFHPSARSTSRAEGGRSSATTIFNVGIRDEASRRVDEGKYNLRLLWRPRTTMVQTAKLLGIVTRSVRTAGPFQQSFQQKL